MSHTHFCHVAGHYWECPGTALRYGGSRPSICICLPCGLPLEGFDHNACHDPVELLACPEHRSAGDAMAAVREDGPGVEPVVLRDENGNPVYGFCLWCNKNFYCWEEVEAHNAHNMKACPVHEELVHRPGGYPYMPPILQDMLAQAGLLKGREPEKGGDPRRKQ